ncbi:MAG: helix-turn-helix transcriptional regulator [Sneathiella sp.]|nr:helix-turn-helix transcriptional regulator [Sneathiella sp.]
MENQQSLDLNVVFKALADPTRREILKQLSKEDAYVSQLAEPHKMSLAAVSRHVQVLTNAGLMHRTREGKSIRCHLNAVPLKEATDWLAYYSQFWEQKLDSFGAFLKEEK